MSVKEVFHVIVDYRKSLLDMIKAGDYWWYNDSINADHFPIQGSGQVELDIELINYDQSMESDEVIQALNAHGLRPVTLPELLAFGATYPDVQRDFPIVALGSVWRYWRVFRNVSSLYVNDPYWTAQDDRVLCLCWHVRGKWLRCYRFAAVRK